MALIKRCSCQSHKSESLVSIVGNDLDSAVVYAHLFVGVSDGDVDGDVVVESVVGVVKIELGQRSICDFEFGFLGKEDEPEYDQG